MNVFNNVKEKSTIELISNFILIFTTNLLNTWILDRLVILYFYAKIV